MHPLAALFGAHPDLTEQTYASQYVKALTDHGLSLMLCKPGTKEPLDLRTPKEIEDDQEAWTQWRESEKAAGRTPSGSDRHPGGLYLATTDAARVRKHLRSAYKGHDEARAELDYLRARRDIAAHDADPSSIPAERADDLNVMIDSLRSERDALAAEAPRKGSKKYQRLGQLTALIDHAPLDSSQINRIATLERETEFAFPNLAVNVGWSNLVVVDCDTAEQVELFQQWAAYMSGDDSWLHTRPTVSSPGAMRDGEWIHKDGGHYYFSVPAGTDVPAPVASEDGRTSVLDALGQIDQDRGTSFGPVRPISESEATTVKVSRDDGLSFDIFVNKHYVLIPPSRRPEGEYVALGPSMDLPQWLYDYIIGDGLRRREERAAKERDRALRQGLSDEANDALDDWYQQTSWSELLTAHGWTETGVDRACGCPTFGRPGYSNPKSATAHVPGCTYHDSDDPPIHFWSTAVEADLEAKIQEVGLGSGRTLSKLQVHSALNFGGNDGAALRDALDSQGFQSGGATAEYTVRTTASGFGTVDTVLDYGVDDGGDDYSEFSLTAQEHVPDHEPVAQPAPSQTAPAHNPFASMSQQTPAPAQNASPQDNPFAAATDQVGGYAGSRMASPDEGLSEEYVPPAMHVSDDDDDDDDLDLHPMGDESPVANNPFAKEGEGEDRTLFRTAVLAPEPPRFYSIDQLVAKRDPVKFLVQDFIQQNALSVVVGPSNAGKSAVLLDILCHISADKFAGEGEFGTWMGIKTKRANVLYVAGEGVDGVINRITAWEQHHGRSVREHFLLTESPFYLDAPEMAWQGMAERIKALNVDVIVLDTLASMMLGLEENSNDDMGKVVSRLQRLCEDTKTSIILVHHTGKSAENITPRGASALTGAIASQILVQKRDFESLPRDVQTRFEDEQITPIRVSVTKQKDARYLDPLDLTLVGKIPVPPRPGKPTTNDFNEEIGYTTILVGDAQGNIPTDPSTVVTQTDLTPRHHTSDTQGLAIRLIEAIALYGCGPDAKRQMSMLRRAKLEPDLFHRVNATEAEPISRQDFAIAFKDAITLAIRSGAIIEDRTGTLSPNLVATTRRDMQAATQVMTDRVLTASADDLSADPDAVDITTTGGLSGQPQGGFGLDVSGTADQSTDTE